MIDLTQAELIALIIGVVVFVTLLTVLMVMARNRHRRRERLTERFGPEYDRTLDTASRRRDAEDDLQARIDRHADIRTHPIGSVQAQAFEQRLDDLQTRFVDAPAAAVVSADSVLADIAVAAGYPDGPMDRLMGDISVDHPVAVADHRRNQEVARRSGKKTPSTEQLRTALVSGRRLSEALLAPSMTARADADRDADARSGSGRGGDARSGSDRRDDSRFGLDRRAHDRTDADRRDPLGAGAERHEAVRSGSDRRTDPGSSDPRGADEAATDHVIELPQTEQVGQADPRSGSGERPGDGLLGPDGSPGR